MKNSKNPHIKNLTHFLHEEKKAFKNQFLKSSSEGCGVKGGIKPPYHLFFKASCHKHDELYQKGGTRFDRWLSDVVFYNLMRYDVKRAGFSWIKRQYFLIWCKIYFLSVRIRGAKYFNYKTNT